MPFGGYEAQRAFLNRLSAWEGIILHVGGLSKVYLTNIVGKWSDRLRIIAGENKGRSLKALKGLATRPTLDKVRGAVFNALYDVSGAKVLDLFGGSGAMALEALSRGAAHCVIVDSSKAAAQVIMDNTMALGYGDRVDLRCCDFRTALLPQEKFDIIFLDPPYGQGLVGESLNLIIDKALLAKDGIVVAEVSAQEPECHEFPGFCLIKEKRYGAAKILYYRFDEE